MKKLTQEEYCNKVRDIYNDEYSIIGQYDGYYCPIEIRHNICGHRYTVKNAGMFYRGGYLCPNCNRSEYLDLDYPELIDNLKDKTFTHYLSKSDEVIDLICPCCGDIVHSTINRYIKNKRVPCPICSDGFSYPEKFMANFLKMNNIEYKFQFSPLWAKPYCYDFVIPDIKTIIETDGGLGHGFHDAWSRSKEESKRIDDLKDSLAIQNGYKIIRIDCNYENHDKFQYIKNNVYKKLKHIFNIESFNWKLCDEQSKNSMFQQVIKTYKNKTKYVDEIEQLTHVKARTIKKYLTEAMSSGIIPKELIRSSKKTFAYKVDEPRIIDPDEANEWSVYCYEDALLFMSVTDASLYYGFKRGTLYNSLNCRGGYCNGRHFTKYIDLPLNFNFIPIIYPYEEYNNSGSKKIICQYTLDGELIKVFLRKETLPEGYLYSNIFRVISGERDTAYGYQWKLMDKSDEFEIFNLVKDNKFTRQYFCN